MRDRHRSCVARRRGEIGRSFEAAEEVRCLEDDGRRVVRRLAHALGVGDATLVRDFDDLEPEAGRVRPHDLPHLRARRLGDHDLRAARRVLRDEARVCRNGRAVVARRVRDVHARQLADRGLVLEDGLQHALRHLRLVRRVGRQQLTALEDRVDDRGHVVVVDAGAEEADLVDDVLRRELLQVALQLRLGQRRRDRQLTRVAHRLRDVAKELLDRLDTDLREHRLPVGVRERQKAHV